MAMSKIAEYFDGIEWGDVAIHAGVALALTVLIGWFGNAWYAASIAIVLFYGREQAQQAAKANPPVGWRKFVPVFWGPRGQMEFLPVMPVALGVAFAVEAWK